MLKKKVNIILILLVLIGLALSYAFLFTVTHDAVENDSVYFVNGIDYEIPAKTKIIINEDGSLSLQLDEFDLLTSSLPIYETNDKRVILTSEMAFYLPSSNSKFTITKLPQLISVSYDPNSGLVNIEKNNYISNESSGFLYDGHNTYIFFEEMNISYNGKNYKLSPLSYAIVENDNWVSLYDYSTNEYIYEDTSEEVFATSSKYNYSVNLGTDIIKYYNKNISMYSGFTVLKDYFEEEDK